MHDTSEALKTKPTLLHLIGAFQLGLQCPVCGDVGLVWDVQSQDVDCCEACERLCNFLGATGPTKKPDNVILLYRSPNTGRLDDIPF